MTSHLSLPCVPACVLAFVLVVPSASSSPLSDESKAGEPEAVADRFVHERLATWQKRLQLQEWTISLVISHPSDLRQGTLGNIRWDADKKTARIRVLSVSDYKGSSLSTALQDMEFTIVHELIHLEFSPVTRSEQNRSAESRSAEEEAVNRLANTLLGLDRMNSNSPAMPINVESAAGTQH